MIQFFKRALNIMPGTDYKELLKNGAILIDVRTRNEYQSGHIEGSLNISLQDLRYNLSELDKDKIIIVCCASVARSDAARSILKSNGFAQVHNGGGWVSLQNSIG